MIASVFILPRRRIIGDAVGTQSAHWCGSWPPLLSETGEGTNIANFLGAFYVLHLGTYKH